MSNWRPGRKGIEKGEDILKDIEIFFQMLLNKPIHWLINSKQGIYSKRILFFFHFMFVYDEKTSSGLISLSYTYKKV